MLWCGRNDSWMWAAAGQHGYCAGTAYLGCCGVVNVRAIACCAVGCGLRMLSSTLLAHTPLLPLLPRLLPTPAGGDRRWRCVWPDRGGHHGVSASGRCWHHNDCWPATHCLLDGWLLAKCDSSALHFTSPCFPGTASPLRSLPSSCSPTPTRPPRLPAHKCLPFPSTFYCTIQLPG